MQMGQTHALEEESGETFDILRFLQTAADYHLAEKSDGIKENWEEGETSFSTKFKQQIYVYLSIIQ